MATTKHWLEGIALGAAAVLIAAGHGCADSKRGAEGPSATINGPSGRDDGEAGSSGMAGSGSPEPEAPWTPPFELGNAGWRESEEALCNGAPGSAATLSIWSGAGGVYVLTGSRSDYFASNRHQRLHFNDGSGWRVVMEREGFELGYGLSGAGGKPLIYGGESCGLELWDGGEVTCSAAAAVTAVFAVDEQHSYALAGNQVLQFADGLWTPLGDAIDTAVLGRALWANDEWMVVLARPMTTGARNDIYVRSASETAFTRIAAPSDLVPVSVWGFARNDLWFGDNLGRLHHYDGSTFEVVVDGLRDCSSAVYLWGVEDVLYFRTSSVFGRVVAGEPEELQRWSCTDTQVTMRHMAGDAVDELFMVISDLDRDQSDCGPFFALWWDGDDLHRF